MQMSSASSQCHSVHQSRCGDVPQFFSDPRIAMVSSSCYCSFWDAGPVGPRQWHGSSTCRAWPAAQYLNSSAFVWSLSRLTYIVWTCSKLCSHLHNLLGSGGEEKVKVCVERAEGGEKACMSSQLLSCLIVVQYF